MKAAFLRRFGFDREGWRVLEKALLEHARDAEVAEEEATPFGTQYALEVPLRTPDGRDPPMRTGLAAKIGRAKAALRHGLPGQEWRQSVMIEEFKEAVLVKDFPKKGLVAGDVSTVVDVHRADDGSVAGYTLEFFSLSGETLAVTAVTADAVRPVDPGEVIHARAM